MRQPGIEPGSIAWKATMLTIDTTDAVYNILLLPQKILIFSGTMMKFYIIPPHVTFENSNFLLSNYLRQPESNPDLLLGRQQC